MQTRFDTVFGMRAARTQALTTTNYDAGSATWADLRAAPFPSAMKVTDLGHGPSCSPIDPVQVSEFHCACVFHYTIALTLVLIAFLRCEITYARKLDGKCFTYFYLFKVVGKNHHLYILLFIISLNYTND